jgi:hypothetical protein
MTNDRVAARTSAFPTLVDDGTLDTVYACSRCGHWVMRYSPDAVPSENAEREEFEEFNAWILADFAEQHECTPDPRVVAVLERLQECANELERVFLSRGADSPYFGFARDVDTVCAKIQEHEEVERDVRF